MSSPFNNAATDGTDVGVNFGALAIPDYPTPEEAGPPPLPPGDGGFVAGTLDWLPTMPDRTRSLAPRHGASTFVTNVVPIPTPLPPTVLTWQGFYPNQVVRPRVYLRQRFRAEPIRDYPRLVTPIVDLGWLPVYPDQLPRRPRLRGTSVATPPSANEALPTVIGVNAWQPTYPDQLPRPLRRHIDTGMLYRIDAATIPVDVTCVEWTTETLTRSILDEETLGRSTLTAEAVSRAVLDEETVC